MDNTQLIRVTIRESESNKEEVSPLHLVVNRSQTVGETKKMLIDRDSSLAVDELMFDGEGVEDNRLLSSFPSSEKSSLLFTARRRTLEVRTARRKPRCSHKNCNSTPLRGVGDCRNCNGKFCSRHRLMEQHDCAGLQGCKQQLHERNAMRLQQQQTMPNKGVCIDCGVSPYTDNVAVASRPSLETDVRLTVEYFGCDPNYLIF